MTLGVGAFYCRSVGCLRFKTQTRENLKDLVVLLLRRDIANSSFFENQPGQDSAT